MTGAGAASPATTEPPAETWRTRYHRALLTHVGVDPDQVDLSTVTTTSTWEEPWSHSEYTGGGGQFEIHVSWRTSEPSHRHHPSDSDGLFIHGRSLSNEEVAQFLNALTSP